jgi:diacylglycerol kinase (ATP)
MTVDACESRSAAHFDELVRAGLDGDAEVLALAGGDGTVAMALNASPSHNRVPWAILPTGSGNDFAKQLGIHSTADTLDVLEFGVPRTVDAGTARFCDQVRRYCCVASIGLDALALQMIHGSSLPRCKALNIVSALRALWQYRPRGVRIAWEGGAFEGEIMFAAVTNTRSYGGGFMVSPQACLHDGLLDLCIVRRTGRFRLLTQFPRILRGTLGVMPEVIQAQTPWVRMAGILEELPVALDGDLPEAMTPLELRCEPASVCVVVPPSWKPGM